MNQIEEIKGKYEILVNEMRFKRKYYHLNSIRNFIIHLDSFGTQYYKSEAIFLLNKYLDFALEKPFIERSEAKEIFDNYINPIGKIYISRLQFSSYNKLSDYLFILMIIFIFIVFLKINIFVFIIILLLLSLSYILKYRKYKINKVYGFDF